VTDMILAQKLAHLSLLSAELETLRAKQEKGFDKRAELAAAASDIFTSLPQLTQPFPDERTPITQAQLSALVVFGKATSQQIAEQLPSFCCNAEKEPRLPLDGDKEALVQAISKERAKARWSVMAEGMHHAKHTFMPQQEYHIVDSVQVRASSNERPYLQEIVLQRQHDKPVLVMNDLQREAHKVSYVNGVLKYQDKDADTSQVTSKNQRSFMAFVMAKNGEVFMAKHSGGKKATPDGKILTHASFLGADPVEMAGLIQVKKGKITAISNNSGHYAPDELDMYRGIVALRKQWPEAFVEQAVVYIGDEKMYLKQFMKRMETIQPESGKPLHEEMRTARIEKRQQHEMNMEEAVSKTATAVYASDKDYTKQLIRAAHFPHEPTISSQCIVGAMAETMGMAKEEVNKLVASMPEWPPLNPKTYKEVWNSLKRGLEASRTEGDPEIAKDGAVKAMVGMFERYDCPVEMVAQILNTLGAVDRVLAQRNQEGQLGKVGLSDALVLIRHGALPKEESLAALSDHQLNMLFETAPEGWKEKMPPSCQRMMGITDTIVKKRDAKRSHAEMLGKETEARGPTNKESTRSDLIAGVTVEVRS